MKDNIIWESAHDFIERQTRKIAREFKTSRPKPRNKAMGFKDPWQKPRKYSDYDQH